MAFGSFALTGLPFAVGLVLSTDFALVFGIDFPFGLVFARLGPALLAGLAFAFFGAGFFGAAFFAGLEVREGMRYAD